MKSNHVPLRLLLINNSEDETYLLLGELRRGGYEIVSERVDTWESMVPTLEKADWDAVVCDYSVSEFGVLEVLEVLQERGLDLPFIIVSGPVGEEASAETIRAGAHDYIMKNNLTRLGAAIQREMSQAEERREKRQTEETLRQSEERYRAMVEQTKEGIFLFDASTHDILEFNTAFQEMLGYTHEELLNMKLYDLVAHDRENSNCHIRRVLDEGSHFLGEKRYCRKDGLLVDVEVSANRILYGGRQVICTIVRDVTERKRTEKNLRRSLDMLLALREAGQVLSSTLKSEEIETRLLEIMLNVSGLTTAAINIKDDRGQLRIGRAAGLERLWRRARYSPEAEAARWAVLESGQYRQFRLRRPDSKTEHLTGLCLPLQMRDRTTGVLEAYGPENLVEDDVIEILRSLAAQAASALENARLYEELAAREEQLENLVGKLLVVQEEERRRVAYEVHDGPVQLATATHQHLHAFARVCPPGSDRSQKLLDKALALIQRTVEEARRVIADLRPTTLDDFGLQAAIRVEMEALQAEGWSINYETSLRDNERLPTAIETTLFRVVQEALRNIRKHARTKRIYLLLDCSEDRVRLVVRDWGCGFDPAAPPSGGGPGEKVGLSSMRERVALLGGEFEIRSKPGTGTSVTVQVPLPKQAEDNCG